MYNNQRARPLPLTQESRARQVELRTNVKLEACKLLPRHKKGLAIHKIP